MFKMLGSAATDLDLLCWLRHFYNGWMTCKFTSVLTVFQSYQDDVLDNNERLCAMELRLRLRRFHLE